jgi:hypothetical protein
MLTSIRSCFLAVSVGLLLASVNAGAAESPKNSADGPVQKCQAGCKIHKDNEAYEGCMLKCKETHKSALPVLPAPKKSK